MVQEIVRNLLVYVVMTTILRGLVSDKGFQEIFRFVSGLILILLFISPVLSVLSLNAGWYQKLEENIFQVDKKQLEQEMQLADGSFEKILLGECEKQLEQQLRDMAADTGQTAEEVEVSLQEGEDGAWMIEQVHMTIGQEAQAAMAQDEEDSEIAGISKIVVEGWKDGNGQTEQQYLQEDEDTRRLKKEICSKYQLSEEAVDVWKINGENY